MSVKIPGELFTQFHSGWKVTFAYVEGAGYRICIENPEARRFLTFRIEKQNEQILHDSLRLTHRNQEEPGTVETEQVAPDVIGNRSSP